MHKVNHFKQPQFFYRSFASIEAVHSHNTRQKQFFEYFFFDSKRYSVKIFLHLEVLNHGLLLIMTLKSWVYLLSKKKWKKVLSNTN